MIIKRLITIVILLFSNTLISQTFDKSDKRILIKETGETLVITYGLYLNYIKSLDKSSIEDFGAKRNQIIVSIKEYDYRQYSVTYMDYYSQKLTQGVYNGKQHDWGTWEEYVKKRIRWRKEEIEEEKKRIIAQKKFEKEEKERKRRERVERDRKMKIEKRKSFVEHLNDKPYQRYLLFGKHVRWFSGDETLFTDYMEFDFIENKKFMSYGFNQSDEIEEVGELQIRWKDSSKGVFSSLKIGVKHMFDDQRISYYVNGVKTDFDFELGNLSFYGSSNYESQKEKLLKYGFLLFDKKVNHPYLYVSQISTVKDLFEFLSDLKSGYLFTKEEEIKLYKRNSYKGIGRNIINGFIKKEIDLYIKDNKWYLVECKVTEVKDKKSKLEWKLEIYRGYDLLNSSKFKFDKKDLVVEEKSTFGTDIYKGSRVEKMLKGDYEYSDIMNN